MGWRTRAFMMFHAPASALWLTARVADRGLRLAARGLVCAGAGLLRPEDVRHAIVERWQRFGAGDEFIDSGFLPWEQELYPRFLRHTDDILVVGAGTGRDLLALLRAGYRAEGLEPAAAAASTARAALRARGFEVPVVTGRIETVDLPKPYDAVVFSWCCYSLIPQRESRVASLVRVRDRLKPGGRIVLSYFYCAKPPRRAAAAITGLVARLARSGWCPERNDVLLWAEGGLHYEHRFRPEELDEEARTAGLEVAFHAWDEAYDGRAVLTPRT